MKRTATRTSITDHSFNLILFTYTRTHTTTLRLLFTKIETTTNKYALFNAYVNNEDWKKKKTIFSNFFLLFTLLTLRFLDSINGFFVCRLHRLGAGSFFRFLIFFFFFFVFFLFFVKQCSMFSALCGFVMVCAINIHLFFNFVNVFVKQWDMIVTKN